MRLTLSVLRMLFTSTHSSSSWRPMPVGLKMTIGTSLTASNPASHQNRSPLCSTESTKYDQTLKGVHHIKAIGRPRGKYSTAFECDVRLNSGIFANPLSIFPVVNCASYAAQCEAQSEDGKNLEMWKAHHHLLLIHVVPRLD